MGINRFIFDASVAVKWFFDEDEDEKARRFLKLLLRKEIEIIVPELFYCEFANACWKKVSKKLVSPTYASQALDDIQDLPLERYPDYELYDVAFGNAIQYGISSYDGFYVALAEIYVAPLVTADEILLKACRGRFDFIESLKDL